MTDKELLQQALAALLEYDYAKTDKADKLGGAAIYALRIAIAQPEQIEGDAKDARISALEEALAGLMRWQVKNVKVWHN